MRQGVHETILYTLPVYHHRNILYSTSALAVLSDNDLGVVALIDLGHFKVEFSVHAV